MLKIDN
jgi:hypothetical protein